MKVEKDYSDRQDLELQIKKNNRWKVFKAKRAKIVDAYIMIKRM